jgi:hypothetical protein
VKSAAHQLHADKVVLVTGALGVRGLAHGYLDFLKCLEDRNVVITSEKQRPNLLDQQRWQQFYGENAAFPKGLNVRSCLQLSRAARRHIPSCGLSRVLQY